MRTSKYLNKEFDNGWKCIHVGIANIQGKKAKYAGHRGYYYILERRTSDNKTDKMIRLNCNEAAQVYQGKVLVEQILDKRESKIDNKFTREVYYERLK